MTSRVVLLECNNWLFCYVTSHHIKFILHGVHLPVLCFSEFLQFYSRNRMLHSHVILYMRHAVPNSTARVRAKFEQTWIMAHSYEPNRTSAYSEDLQWRMVLQ